MLFKNFLAIMMTASELFYLRNENQKALMEALVNDSLITMTAMTASLGRLKISAIERAKTIVVKTKEPLKKRHESITNGLGIDYSTVADVGENAMTEAALATVKLLLQNGIKPSEIKTFIVATESGTGVSENMSIQVIRTVNLILSTLTQSGMKGLDEFKPQVKQHIQSACASAGSAISNFATNGLEGGKAIVVATDKAEYKFRTTPDSTGGFGSVAHLLEKSTENTRGIRYSRIIGSASKDIPDFLKPIIEDMDKESGLALVAKFALVFGEYSNQQYSNLRYKSIRDFAKNSGLNFDTIDILKLLVILPHLPYPEIYVKEMANYLRHLARENEEIRAKVLEQTNNKEIPTLGDYREVGRILDFLGDMGALYHGMVGIPKELKSRLAERQGGAINGEFIEQKLSMNKEYIINGALNEINTIVRDHVPSGNLLEAIKTVSENLDSLKAGSEMSLNMLESAFRPLYDDTTIKIEDKKVKLGLISRFEDIDKEYNAVLRGTELFAWMMKELDPEKAVKLNKKTGNLYTGSQSQCKMSHITESEDPAQKFMLDDFYGSGGEAIALFNMLKEAEELIERTRANLEEELRLQKAITAEDYEFIRTNSLKIENKDAPLTQDMVFRHVNANEKQLVKHLEFYINAYNTLMERQAVPLKQEVVQPTHAQKLRSI